MSTLRILDDLEQRSEAWFAARRGIVSASVTSKLVTCRAMTAIEYPCPSCLAPANSPCLSRAKKVPEPIKTLHTERTLTAVAGAEKSPRILETATGDDARNLTLTIVAERLSGVTEDSYISGDMWRGIEQEPFARDRYAEANDVKVTEVGLMIRDFDGYSIAYSPDGLVGEDGLLEVKSPRGKTHVQTVLSDEVPTYNMAQIQTGLLVSGRKWLDFLPWFAGLPLWTKRVYPDPRWHAAILAAVQTFEHNAAVMCADYKQATKGLPMTERQEVVVI